MAEIHSVIVKVPFSVMTATESKSSNAESNSKKKPTVPKKPAAKKTASKTKQ